MLAAVAILVVAEAPSSHLRRLPPPPPPPPPPPNTPPPNTPPVADAGRDFAGSIEPGGFELNGSASNDADGDALSYTWIILSQPEDGGAVILHDDAAVARLQTSAPGVYTVELEVSDPRGASDTDTVQLTLYNDAPLAVAEASLMMPAISEEVLLDATRSSDPNGQMLTYRWILTGAPPRSGVPVTQSGAVAPVVFDVEGEYSFRLEVSDGYETSSTQLGPIVVSRFSMQLLDAPFEHVAVQPGGGKVVTVSGRQMVVRDQHGEETGRVSLPASAYRIVISQNGGFAAAAHQSALTFINLTTHTVIATYDVDPGLQGAMVIDNDGTVHLLGTRLQGSVLSIRSEDGSMTYANGGHMYSGLKAKMHPSGSKSYYVLRGISPSDIKRISFEEGLVTDAYDSPYHGNYPFCASLWISSDGGQILTGCGVVVLSTDDRATDMTYLGRLPSISAPYADEPGPILDAIHSSYTGSWYLLMETGRESGVSRQLRIYDGASMALADTIEMPVAPGQEGRQLYAKSVWTSDTEDAVYVLAQDDATNAQAYYLLRTRAASGGTLNYPPVIALQKYSAGRVGEPVIIDAGASRDPEGQPLSYVWRLVSQPSLSAVAPSGMRSSVLSFTPVEPGTYVFDVAASDGQSASQSKAVTVHVAGAGESLIGRLEGNIVDAEFSSSLNTLAYITQDAQELVLLSTADFSERRIELPRIAHGIGVSPDGRAIAVSHPGLVSLVDLATGRVVDTQEHNGNLTDVVLDDRRRAHLPSVRAHFWSIISIDFSEDRAEVSVDPYGGPVLKLHPNGDWIYAPLPSFTMGSFRKWDISGMPASYLGTAPDQTPTFTGEMLWFSDEGDSFITAAGQRYESSNDPDTDMTLVDTLRYQLNVNAADHSSETGLWAIGYRDGRPNGMVGYFRDTDLQEVRTILVHPPMDLPNGRASAVWLFLSEDGETTFILSQSDSHQDSFSLQVEGR